MQDSLQKCLLLLWIVSHNANHDGPSSSGNLRRPQPNTSCRRMDNNNVRTFGFVCQIWHATNFHQSVPCGQCLHYEASPLEKGPVVWQWKQIGWSRLDAIGIGSKASKTQNLISHGKCFIVGILHHHRPGEFQAWYKRPVCATSDLVGSIVEAQHAKNVGKIQSNRLRCNDYLWCHCVLVVIIALVVVVVVVVVVVKREAF
mmetsp:Transcript_21642/g.50801  ORF Transcript_21642/g.50801 Transcript_21642/m.50801 type:complete len:201 (-) Transcript_21642:226-828(-)